MIYAGACPEIWKGGPQFLVYTFPPKISVKTKQEKVFTSSDVQFIPQNQVKTKKRSTRPHMSCFHCSADCRYIAYTSGGGRATTPAPPLDAPLCYEYYLCIRSYLITEIILIFSCRLRLGDCLSHAGVVSGLGVIYAKILRFIISHCLCRHHTVVCLYCSRLSIKSL